MKHLRQYIRQILVEKSLHQTSDEQIRDAGDLQGFMRDYRSQSHENPIGVPGERYWFMGKIDDHHCLVLTNLRIDERLECIRFSSIQTAPPEICEGQGFASKVMSVIVALADKHRVTLRLSVHPFGQESLSGEDLSSWYSRNGFKLVPGYNRVMERIPNKGAA